MDESSRDRAHIARVTNSSAADKRLILEPWGEEYMFPVGGVLDIVSEGPRDGFPEFDFADEHITIYGWPGAVISIFLDGIELGANPQKRTPVPPTPAPSR
jgi:hypothetical protein